MPSQYKIGIGIGVGILVAVSVVVVLSLPKGTLLAEEYDIFVDPLLDKQILFVMGRVTIQNTGNQPLSNVRVNFGSGDIQELGTLKPGQKIILSPPSDNPMEFVIVTADEIPSVSKAYREPVKMPGMMGS